MQAALEKEYAETEATAAKDAANGEDHDMGGTDETVKVKDDDELSDVGSEDLEASSSDEEDEEDEEEGAEVEGDEDMEMGDAEAEEKPSEQTNGDQKPIRQHEHAQVMVH
jgi:histone chaperone ASF1